jgi:dihydropteroate synthase/2-amino-4-hydroxy-6-hydroxymethyldihydropteridine diphosphokinase
MARVYLALGSNLGSRLVNLRAVEAALAPAVRILRASPVYETAPFGYADQPAFLNQVLEAETELAPADLLALAKQVEAALGREVTFRNGPRQIDVDILFYAGLVLDAAGLQIPHPRMRGRAFVLRPLADLIPAFIHPVVGETVASLAAETSAADVWPYKGLAFGRKTYVMGILNVTPDSFSGDGLMQSGDPLESALAQARAFNAAGADLLDVGGESTRPGSQPVSVEEELARVLPVVRALAGETNAVISVDTSKALVAQECLRAGADWINDVWGLRADPALAAVCARAGAPVVLMHNRSNPASAEVRERLGGRYVGMKYANLLADVKSELMESVALARAAGVLERSIILDPGIGFGKTVEQNLELIDRLGEIRALGFPLLLGPSRKSFIGYTLDLPPAERLEGTAAAAAVGIARGADIIRVHDVLPLARVARMTDAIVRRAGQAGS